ncbi:hypothetical protein HC766_05750 [Candidatus Gracilibacteria bacterium]|nr:hypothetical protein [Candidatus Gracilibacteria bacterium]NJS41800.1 hypothetical protein [Candidatus Gracilibacteria bacterium]
MPKKPTPTKHTHTNFSKFLITVIIFLSVVVLALFSVLWEQMYEVEDMIPKEEPMMVESNIEIEDPSLPELSTNINSEEISQSTGEEWTGEITLAPTNKNRFDKSNTQFCGGNGIQYIKRIEGKQEFDEVMYISNRNLFDEEKTLQRFNSIDKFINNNIEVLTADKINTDKPIAEISNQVNEQYFTEFKILGSTSFPCEFYGFGEFSLIPFSINYPGADSAFIFERGVFAKKSDNYIYLEKIRNEDIINLRVKYSNECNEEGVSFEGMDPRNTICVNQKLSRDSGYKQIITDQAQSLIETFKLQ